MVFVTSKNSHTHTHTHTHTPIYITALRPTCCRVFQRNVRGMRCDQCVPKSFGLSADNPDGCTSCFCFTRSGQCSQAEFSWVPVSGYSAVRSEVFFTVVYQQAGFSWVSVLAMEGPSTLDRSVSTDRFLLVRVRRYSAVKGK